MPLCAILLKRLHAQQTRNDSLAVPQSNPPTEEDTTLHKHLHNNGFVYSRHSVNQGEGDLDYLSGSRPAIEEPVGDLIRQISADNSRTPSSDVSNQFTANASWKQANASVNRQEMMTSSVHSIIDRIVDSFGKTSQISANSTAPFGETLNTTSVLQSTNATNSQETLLAKESDSFFIHEFQLIKAVVLIIVLTVLMLSTCRVVLKSSAKHGQTKDEAA